MKRLLKAIRREIRLASPEHVRSIAWSLVTLASFLILFLETQP